MAEEQRCQAQRLCVNNCGFFGSPATQNLCSKCHRDLQLKEQRSSSVKLAFDQTLPSPSPPSSSSAVSVPVPLSPACIDAEEEKIPAVDAVAKPNRCGKCRKRVGLTGFKCRCGTTFCGTHRYAEQHNCGFDFKTMDRDAIARANPVVKGDKLHKI